MLEPYEICAWLCGRISKRGWRFLHALRPCCAVDRQWRLATEALLRALGLPPAPWRAAQALVAWWHQPCTAQLSGPLAHGLVASALGEAFAQRFGFRRALKRVRWRPAVQWLPGESEESYEAREEQYKEDDGPVVMPGTEIEGYGALVGASRALMKGH